ncbi:MAG: zinc-binding protein, partial [Desulfobacteraceae bacterium]|nr:zinc-binding protein [Desulfobacteraceae bacterium]
MSSNCRSNEKVMVLACSGGSNVGQLSNQAGIDLTREGYTNMFCLAGIGASLKGFINSATATKKVVAVDGCDVGCAKAILEKNGIENKHHVVITDLGIEKNKNFDQDASDLDKVKAKIKE